MASTLALGLFFFIFFCWAVKDGQFEDTEEAKYELFREPPEHRHSDT
ncbi:MAG: cbb3-type cytochrome oxidase assembly protein CcoS [Chitinivibrionales bacterium]|nr:cbb3-type cytochrome oxidase assembly protein CcoS [Chitinivibrionales bacterium]